LIISFESSKFEDYKWQDVNTRLINEEFMRKGKGETSYVNGKATPMTIP